jgi:hypothetical protein
MQYRNGSEVLLGDVVSVPVPDGSALARVVMIGDTRNHLTLNARFLEWMQEKEDLLDDRTIVIEWLDENPFANDDPRYAPIGNYMFSPMDEFVVLIRRDEL